MSRFNAPRYVRLIGAITIFFGCATAHAGAIVAIDVGDGPVQSGFAAFPVGFRETNGAAITHSYGGISVSIDELTGHFWRARDRGDQGANGTFTQSDLLRDFVTSSDGYSISVLMSGLTPGAIYDLQVWSYDPFSEFSFRSDWTANGLLVQKNYSQSHGTPLTNDDYRFGFMAVADSSGRILILGTPQDSSDGVRINALQLSSADAAHVVPEPSSLLVLGSFAVALCYSKKVRPIKGLGG